MRRWPRFYKLVDKNPVPCTMMEWAENMDGPTRQLALTKVHGDENFQKGIVVSTVFLGLDHNYFDRGPPVLFETMIFGGTLNQSMMRYATYDEALVGHDVAVKKVKAAMFRLINGGKGNAA